MNPCRCKAFEQAAAEGLAYIWRDSGEWIFVDTPLRQRSLSAWRVKDHTGEPFTWSCCPYCGGDLTVYSGPKWTNEDGG